MTKANQKFIKQLQQKKYRKLHKAFVVEGLKSISDFLKAGFTPLHIYATTALDEQLYPDFERITNKELRQISFLKHPHNALAVFKMKPVAVDSGYNDFILALDNLQDPGNLGTIIRTADWFGIRQIVCSKDTVDCYNPKVVQATMGALANVSVTYTDLAVFLQDIDKPVYGTFLHGDNIYKTALPAQAVVVIGNEGNGIRPDIEKLVSRKITIPKSPEAIAESLNASVAAAVVMNEFFRQNF